MTLPALYNSGLQRTATATLWRAAVVALRCQHTSTGVGQQSQKNPAFSQHSTPSSSSTEADKPGANLDAYRRMATVTWEGATESKKKNVWEEAMDGLKEDSKWHSA